MLSLYEKGKQLIMDTPPHILSIIIAFFAAEMPIFALVLHLSNRIVRLETQINYLAQEIKK